jgi:peroxiredoxin
MQLIGQPAPAFALESLSGEKVRLEEFRGRVVVLDFWATWCPPCMAAMPELEKLQASFAGQPVTVIGVNQQEERQAIKEMVEERGLTFLQVLDDRGSVAEAFHVSGIPQTVLIDATGVVQAVHVGYSPQMKQTLTDQINRVLNGEQLFDAKSVAEVRERLQAKRDAIVQQIGLVNEDRLLRLDNVLEDDVAALVSTYTAPQWIALPGESEAALCLIVDPRRLVIVRPAAGNAETIDLQLPEQVGVWDFSPILVEGQVHWAVIGAESGDDYDLKQFTLAVCNSEGKALWTKIHSILEVDSYPTPDLAAGDLTGDGVPEIAVLVEHDGFDEAGVAGPEGSTRVLSVYDLKGELMLRSFVPGHGGGGLYVLPGADAGTLLMGTSEGLTRFRVK